MIKVKVGNSYSSIHGLSSTQERILRDTISYTVGDYFSGFGPRKVSLLSKRCEFPTGLLNRVKQFLVNVDHEIVSRPELSLLGVSQVPTSATISTSYLWQEEALEAAVKYRRGTISAPTGSGKSRVIQMIVERFGLKTLIVVPTLEIKTQLTSTLKSLKNVTVENIDSKKLKTLTDFDLLILDECHHAAAKTYQKLNKTAWTGIQYRICATATPFRNDTEETLLYESIAGGVIYKLSYQDAVLNKYVLPIEAYYIEIPKQATDAYAYRDVYNRLVVNNAVRNERLAYLILSLNSSDKSTLCLVKEIAHGEALKELSGIPFVNGQDEESREFIGKFNSREQVAVIGTTGVLGEGIDTRPCEYVIIAGLGKARSQFMQQVGRALRTYPGKDSAKIILVKDRSHKFLSRHFATQCAILREEYGVIATKIDI